MADERLPTPGDGPDSSDNPTLNPKQKSATTYMRQGNPILPPGWQDQAESMYVWESHEGGGRFGSVSGRVRFGFQVVRRSITSAVGLAHLVEQLLHLLDGYALVPPYGSLTVNCARGSCCNVNELGVAANRGL